MHIEPDDPRLVRPSWGCLLFGVPIVAVIATFAAYAWLFASGMLGRPAQGDTVEVVFRSCAEARPIVERRVAAMGLADASFEPREAGFALVATLPEDPDVAASIPGTLATPGHFAIKAVEDGRVLVDDDGIASAGVRADLSMSPVTLVRLTDAATEELYAWVNERKEGRVALFLDDVEVWSQSNLKPMTAGELEIPPSAVDDKARMELAASRAIALGDGPLPCPVRVMGVTTVERR